MTDDLDDRLSKRFDADADDTAESEIDRSSQSSERDKNAQNAQNTVNVKKEWNVRSFYLDDDLDRNLMTAFKRLDLELSEAEAEIALKKTRHFYPLIVTLGLERLGNMDVTEIIERIESEKFR